MRTQNLVVTASILVGAVACSGGNSTVGMRFDGVKVECTHEADGVSVCAPVAKSDPCDVASVLWPPNHKMVQFTLADCAPPPTCGGGGDGSGSGSGSGGDGGIGLGGPGTVFRTTGASATATASITSVTSDEVIDVGAGGDGHTTKFDIQIIDATTFALRSERQGGGDGRVYRVNFTDETGATGACEFQVPHDQGPAHGAVDSGTVVTVTP